VAAFTCLWYSVTGTAPVTIILMRDKQEPASIWRFDLIVEPQHAVDVESAIRGGYVNSK
jgi:hypothetical protein